MHKLYKYLPFGVELTNGEEICILTPEMLEQKNIDHISDFKPILRLFSDLTKSLPLTKAAAELLEMKEGEMVVPLRCLSLQFTTNFELIKEQVKFKPTHMIEFDTDLLRAMHFCVDFAKGEFVPKNE